MVGANIAITVVQYASIKHTGMSWSIA